MSLKIYILLPVHNRLQSTRKFIESLLGQTLSEYHLVLIDDGSTDGTAEYVSSRVNSLTIINGRGDWWWGGGLHQGYRWLKKNYVDPKDLVLMINNDTEFGPDFLQKAMDILEQNHKTLLLAKVYSKQSNKFFEAGVHANWHRLTFELTDDPDQINCLSTRGLFLRVVDLMDIGGFHPVLLPHYLSDFEFTIRAHQKGYRLMADPSLKIMVDESTTGVHHKDRKISRLEFLRDYFSKRSSSNPFYWISLVLLVCPWGLKPLNFFRVIYGGLVNIFRKTFGVYNQNWR